MRLSCSLFVLFLAACPAPPVEPEPPDVSGDYTLVGQQLDSDCVSSIASVDQIFGFMDQTATGVPVMTVELEALDGSLSGLLGPSDCTWSGVVGADGSMTLSGPCDGDDVGRIGRVAGNLSRDGDAWALESTLTLEIDTLDEVSEPGPDGLADCEVLLDLRGSGL